MVHRSLLSDTIVAWITFQLGEFIELAILFFVLAIIAAVLGLGGVAGISMRIAKIFVVIFLVLAIIVALL